MRKEELIEKYEHLNHDCFRRVDVSEVLGDLKKLDEPQLLKLKDVIARIKGFDRGTKAVWIDAILSELGSDYGTLKYKAGYEQGKLEGEWVGQQLKDADKIRQELNKPVVPQFVAEWIDVCKENLAIGLYTAMNPDFLKQWNKSDELISWIKKASDQNLFARAWLDGYEVEKERRYLVKMKATGQCLGKYYLNNEILSPRFIYTGRNADDFTRKELEEAGFGWVFDCEGIEVEEVE